MKVSKEFEKMEDVLRNEEETSKQKHSRHSIRKRRTK